MEKLTDKRLKSGLPCDRKLTFLDQKLKHPYFIGYTAINEHNTQNAYARKSDPQTSHNAANSMKNTIILERKILEILRLKGPMTSEEAAIRLNIPLASITPRFRPLTNKNMVRQLKNYDGKPVTRAGASGRKRIVWEVL